MAKHMVKCPHCEQRFDANQEDNIKVGNRYYHAFCYEEYQMNMTQEERDRNEFYQYTKDLFKDNYNYVVIKKTAEKYIEENEYEYKWMTKSLKWFYEIEGKSISNANGNIGIIPYIYTKAKEYFNSIENAKKVNQEKNIEEYIPKVEVVTIERPKFVTKPLKLFNLEED